HHRCESKVCWGVYRVISMLESLTVSVSWYRGFVYRFESAWLQHSYNYECFVLCSADTTEMYHSQKSARQSMLGCGVCNKWLEKVLKINDSFCAESHRPIKKLTLME